LGTPDLTEFHNERFAASRLSMMRIMARRMNCNNGGGNSVRSRAPICGFD
jgi:hypothetical protein